MPEQDSSSTQSSSQSHNVLEGLRHGISNIQSFKPYPELFVGSHLSDDIRPNCIPYTYVDPYYGGFVAAYGAHSFADPQMAAEAAVLPARVPLPIELAEAEPVYVNAKQYHRILRRRQLRAKLEAQNKVVKERKPYLHESRHLHAVKRARGSGGRFLNTKSQQEHQVAAAAAGGDVSGSTAARWPSPSEEENVGGSSASTCSDTTSASNGDVLRPPGGAAHGGGGAAERRRVSSAR
ncbi:unnamed protein product [Spirodela intermedia]|uniref:Nuclear transcription factor Y subunit n=1 Tax=Spirodela intermedia TaxID=51605 RepID=A0A7I8KT51_SPIIN|nr:unnamed protein product [Spirodela intermedia]